MKFSWEITAILAKPCPFCGSKDVVTESKEYFEGGNKSCSYIKCLGCGATLYGDAKAGENGSYERTYTDAQRAVHKKWNRRAS